MVFQSSECSSKTGKTLSANVYERVLNHIINDDDSQELSRLLPGTKYYLFKYCEKRAHTQKSLHLINLNKLWN